MAEKSKLRASPEAVSSGYKLLAVILQRANYELVDPKGDLPETDETDASVSWDWRVVDGLRFDVKLEVSTSPTKSRPERVEISYVGRFERGVKAAPAHRNFVRLNASAILYPYVRETLASLTGRGPFGAVHLEPANIVEGFGSMDPENSAGGSTLAGNAELAARYGWDKK